ncbi:hypothetical protein GMB86_06655 [Terrilactibacillus sp. BCM23-1]|uniref:CvpA family protein n=1 Tax=Terrilactibacillus tamarindi TaxID=2599694 RepID=A0A6N8CNM4_9BACI|nr:CvpA family protein [Terrilactibacillus tamarindi]MTT31692.1 hypothetical protein [Terrilactibacillus tamarindi]
MLSLIIVLLLIAGFFIGLRRGLILQLVHLTGFILAYVVAFIYYGDLAPKLKFWIPYPSAIEHQSMFEIFGNMNLETAYYRAIAFVIIFIAVKIVMQIIGSMLDFLAHLPIIHTVNRLLGGVLGFVEIYLIVFILLYIGALTPFWGLDTTISHSSVAGAMIEHTPVMSEKLKTMWLAYIK